MKKIRTTPLLDTFAILLWEWYLDTNILLSHIQTCLWKKKGTIDYMIRPIIRETFVKKKKNIAIFFDLEKALNKIWKYQIMKYLTCIRRGIDYALYVDLCYKSNTYSWKAVKCIYRINIWTIKNGYKISTTKCEHLCKLRKMHYDSLKINDTQIPVAKQIFRHFRFQTFMSHIKASRSKCNLAGLHLSTE